MKRRERTAPVSMDVGGDHYWVIWPWAARLCLALTFCAGLIFGALIMALAIV